MKKFVTLFMLIVLILFINYCSKVKIINISCRDTSGKPIENVQIYLNGVLQGTTDATGKLTFQFNPEGMESILIAAKHKDYVPVEKKLPIPSEKESGYTFLMEKKRYLEIICKGRKKEGEEPTIPLKDVTIIVDEKVLGTTNDEGVFFQEIKASAGDMLALSVIKEGYTPDVSLPILIDVEANKTKLSKTITFTKLTLPMKINVKVVDNATKAGLKDVQVLVNKKEMGKTDMTGNLNFEIKEPEGTQIVLACKKKDYIFQPEEVNFQVEEGTEKTIQILANFIEKKAKVTRKKSAKRARPTYKPKITGYRVGNLISIVTGPSSKINKDKWYKIIERNLSDFCDSLPYIKKVRIRRLNPQRGWSKSRVNIDYCLAVFVDSDKKNKIEMILYNPAGMPQVREIAYDVQEEELIPVLNRMTASVAQKFPVGGRIIDVSEDTITFNIGADRHLRIGDLFVDPFKNIKTEIVEIQSNTAKATILKGKPKVGDVLFRTVETTFFGAGTALLIKVIDKESGEPIANCSVYRDNLFVGLTDSEGELGINVPRSKPYLLEVSKLGYSPYKKKLIHRNPKELKIKLKMKYAVVHFESIPSGSEVVINGRRMGKTPCDVKLKHGFYKLYFIPYDRENFDVYYYPDKYGVTFPEQELKIVHKGNYIKKAKELEAMNKYEEAALMYAQVRPPSNPLDAQDYITAQFNMGRIYIDYLKDYQKAIKAFNNVLKWDPKYALAYLNLGLALFKAKQYEKAINVFDQTQAYNSYIPRDRFEKAMNDTLLYSAISAYRLFQIKKNLPEESKQWKNEACLRLNKYIDFYNRLSDIYKTEFVKNYEIAYAYKLKVCR